MNDEKVENGDQLAGQPKSERTIVVQTWAMVLRIQKWIIVFTLLFLILIIIIFGTLLLNLNDNYRSFKVSSQTYYDQSRSSADELNNLRAQVIQAKDTIFRLQKIAQDKQYASYPYSGIWSINSVDTSMKDRRLWRVTLVRQSDHLTIKPFWRNVVTIDAWFSSQPNRPKDLSRWEKISGMKILGLRFLSPRLDCQRELVNILPSGGLRKGRENLFLLPITFDIRIPIEFQGHRTTISDLYYQSLTEGIIRTVR